ncbi:MAG: Transcriptional regulator protein [Nitrosopumilales archaeon]|nr:MAG: Transcriptional regulator protein [Nitrosopumilales archaeon]
MKKKVKEDFKVDKLKAELEILKEKKKNLEKKQKSKPSKTNKTIVKADVKKAIKTEKKEKKKIKVKKKTEKKKLKESKIKEEEEKTLEEQLEEQLSEDEIANFQIEKVNMEKLTSKVCVILAEREGKEMIQSELWKKLKLTSRDGSRLALKLERLGTITREKILEKGRWTYKLILKKTPISTQSLGNAPCLTCPVEQKCTLEGDVSPRTCQWIQDWVLLGIKPKMMVK